jgi:hypothetical protein
MRLDDRAEQRFVDVQCHTHGMHEYSLVVCIK